MKYWYEVAAINYPSTNNGLESLNDKIKELYTSRKKLSLSTLLATVEIMLSEWSKRSYKDSFHTFPPVNTEEEKERWKWLHNLGKNSVWIFIHCSINERQA